MGLKLIFLIVTRAVALLGLSRREVWWKDAEILILRPSWLSPCASSPQDQSAMLADLPTATPVGSPGTSGASPLPHVATVNQLQ